MNQKTRSSFGPKHHTHLLPHLYHEVSGASTITSRVLRQDSTRAEPWPVPPCFLFFGNHNAYTHRHTHAHTRYLNIVALNTRKLHTNVHPYSSPARTFARAHTHTHMLSLSHSLIHKHTHARTLSPSLPPSNTHTHTHTHAQTHTHTVLFGAARGARPQGGHLSSSETPPTHTHTSVIEYE